MAPFSFSGGQSLAASCLPHSSAYFRDMKQIPFALAALALAFTVVHPAQAQLQRQPPQSRTEVTLSFSPIVKKATPSVVNVYGARVEQRRNPMFDDPIFRRFFGDGPGSPQVARSLGSGVIADATGLVITNNHVIEGMTEVKIALADKREFEAEIVLRDPRTDLAIIRIKDAPRDLVPIEMGNSDALEVGDFVLAIGNPFGVGQTVTQGIVSALARTQVGVSDYQSFIQTDAAINPGNSGGALVDMSGRLIGINTAIFSRSGGSHGIGFAIPTPLVQLVLNSAKSGGNIVRRPWLGASLNNVTSEIAESIGLPRPVGAIVAQVTKGSPADRAGLRVGDVVASVEGQNIDNPEGFGYRFGIQPIGGRMNVGIIRQGRPQNLVVALEAAPQGKRDALVMRNPSPFLGAKVATLSPALSEELRVETAREPAVVVVELGDNTPSRALGLQPGDIIVGVNGREITSPADLEAATAERSRLWRFQIERGGRVFTSVVGG